MIFRPGASHLATSSPGVNLLSRTFDAWWLANGTISSANVKEHVEFPAIGRNYAGGSIATSSAWSVVARSNSIVPEGITSRYLFDSESGRLVLGISTSSVYGFHAGGTWKTIAIYPDTLNHIWFFIASGSAIQAYLDNSAVGTTLASTVGIATSGATKWRSDYGGAAQWINEMQKGAVYNIALDSTQRAALYAAMSE